MIEYRTRMQDGVEVIYIVVVEAVVGNRLRKPRQPDRVRLRRRHLLLMLGAVLLGILHVVLNGPFPQ